MKIKHKCEMCAEWAERCSELLNMSIEKVNYYKKELKKYSEKCRCEE